MPRIRRAIPLDEKLRSAEKWQTNVSWPAPIDARLNELVDLAIEAGEADALSRSELLAALVLAAEASGESLVDLLRRYRMASVGDAVVGSGTNNVVELVARRPGRR